MSAHEVASGGRISVRRMLVTAAAILGVLMQAAAAAADPESRPTVTVNEQRGVYSVAARLDVPQSSSDVIVVLTDYEQIPRFMPHVDTSVVLERSAGHVVVRQEAVARVMLFSKRVHLVLDISEEQDVLRFRDLCGRSFARYEGTWHISRQNGHSEIRYELTAEPSFDVPELLLKRLLRRDAIETLERLRREIAARAAR